MKKLVILVSLAMLLAVTSAGQLSPTVTTPSSSTSSIVVAGGFNCSTPLGAGTFNVVSWNFGSTLTVTSGAGKPTIQPLFVQKAFDNCSPALFGAVTSGKVYNTVTLTQSDANKDVLMTVTLTNVFVTSYQVSGTQTAEMPTESVGFTFERICIKNANNGANMCYAINQPFA